MEGKYIYIFFFFWGGGGGLSKQVVLCLGENGEYGAPYLSL